MPAIEAFGHHEADPRALLYYEWCQRIESGYAVAEFDEEVHDLAQSDRPLEAACWRLLDRIESAPRLADWPFTEWDDQPAAADGSGALRDSAAHIPLADLAHAELFDRIHGGWLGRCAVGAQTKPLDYTVLGLHLLEQYGADFLADDVCALWLERLPFLRTYTAERVAYRNLIDGFAPPETATHRNPYREWAGALMRADIYGYTSPGAPTRAAALAARDASVSHTGNGLWAAMWAAALIAAAFTAGDPGEALARAGAVIPAQSRLAVELSKVVEDHARGRTWEQAVDRIRTRDGHYNPFHAIGNACLITAGLLWGAGDFTSTVTLTLESGWDADSNGATAGSVAGILTGAARIPERWTAPLGDTLRSAVAGHTTTRISELATRTLHLLP
ncbi:ADP-ribosylglycohydrolase family protein [Nocardia sp. NBC_01327]|uniref:ADP-ribosylglycohydrolase family protein n=1 Tax=Nocardia sp. NBC_01327 TaxID=2903593 RepID=UPI002E0D867D|nr:ADP-ribosylglycohydrolase family protein [Nocardia sp. NBC_01327]